MKPLKVGDILIAKNWCGFPDGTTEGKEYEVTEVKTFPDNRIFFHIINDLGNEVLPISTTFKRKEGEHYRIR